VEQGPTAFAIEELVTLGSDASTSRSLLVRVAANDQNSWRQLVSLYSPLVAHSCRQADLPDSDLDDVIQDVFAAVATGLKNRHQGQPGASLRAWMRGITRHKIQDQFRRWSAAAEGGTDALVRLREVPQPANVPDLSESDAEIAGLHRRALELVRAQFEDRTWQAFWKVVIEETSPAEVARPGYDGPGRPPGQVAHPPPPQARAGRSHRLTSGSRKNSLPTAGVSKPIHDGLDSSRSQLNSRLLMDGGSSTTRS
jgi:RNA polymerase sigma-70 factor, ECF subfamily